MLVIIVNRPKFRLIPVLPGMSIRMPDCRIVYTDSPKLLVSDSVLSHNPRWPINHVPKK